MGQASRAKRKRAAVRSAKRSRHNNWWYILTVFVLIAGVALIVYARMTQPSPVGPYILDQVNQTNPHNKDSHWHAALGVYNCDHWMGDPGSNGVWQWPAATPSGTPARVGNTSVYAGMHITIPIHSAVKWYQRHVRWARPVGARSSFQRPSPAF